MAYALSEEGERVRRCRITATWALTPADLLARERGAPRRLAERLQAVRLVWEGYTGLEAARIIGRDPRVVRAYIQAWNHGGPAALVPGHAPGGSPKLTPEQTAAVVAALQASPAAVGLGPAVNWDTTILQAFIEQQYGVQFSRGHLSKWLHRHGFSWTRPTYVLKRARPAEQAAFREQLETLKKTLPPTP